MHAREEELEAVGGAAGQRLDGLLGVGHAELGVVERGRRPEEVEHAELVRMRAAGFGPGGDLEMSSIGCGGTICGSAIVGGAIGGVAIGGGVAVRYLKHNVAVSLGEQMLMLRLTD